MPPPDASCIADYQRLGFLVLPDFKPADEVAAARARAQALVDAFDPAQGASLAPYAGRTAATATSGPWLPGFRPDG